MHVGEFDNITVNLTRNNPEFHVNVTELQCYDKVFGFDIESDGSVGTVAIPGVIIANMNVSCTLIRNISTDSTRKLQKLLINTVIIIINLMPF